MRGSIDHRFRSIMLEAFPAGVPGETELNQTFQEQESQDKRGKIASTIGKVAAVGLVVAIGTNIEFHMSNLLAPFQAVMDFQQAWRLRK